MQKEQNKQYEILGIDQRGNSLAQNRTSQPHQEMRTPNSANNSNLHIKKSSLYTEKQNTSPNGQPRKGFRLFAGSPLFISLFLLFFASLVAANASKSGGALPCPKALKASLYTLKNTANLISVAVIGSGPAGLSAAMGATLDKRRVVVFGGPRNGGALNIKTRVGNWPGVPFAYGKDLMKKFFQQLGRYKAVITPQTIENINFNTWPFEMTTSSGDKVHALSIVLTTGAQWRIPDIQGLQTYTQKGVVFESGEDAHDFSGKDVVILGGGDNAVTHAYYALKKAKSVTLVVRSTLKAAGWRTERIKKMAKKKKKFTILYNQNIQEISGNGKKVTSVVLKNGSSLLADLVVVSIGRLPRNDLYKHAIRCDEKGYIILKGRDQATNIPGVYAAGDNAGIHYGQAGIAAGDGMKAGYDAIWHLERLGLSRNDEKSLSKNFYQPKETFQEKRWGPFGIFG